MKVISSESEYCFCGGGYHALDRRREYKKGIYFLEFRTPYLVLKPCKTSENEI